MVAVVVGVKVWTKVSFKMCRAISKKKKKLLITRTECLVLNIFLNFWLIEIKYSK